MSGWKIEPRGEYPPDWPAIARAVKDAAGWCCIRCGHSHDVESRHVLTVHHLNGDKGDSRWWNLLALCQRCHLSIQGRVDPEQAYLHPHTPWFRVYAAGFYAATVLHLELTREEAQARLVELLVAGQPWLSPLEVMGEQVPLGELTEEDLLHALPPELPRLPAPEAPLRIRCLDCGAPYLKPPPGWSCTCCGGRVSAHAGTIHVPGPDPRRAH